MIMARNIVANAFKHFNLINRHRWAVFKLCCKAGIPFRGLVHDLSKYSFTEFWESAKFYNGHLSPIPFAKKEEWILKSMASSQGKK